MMTKLYGGILVAVLTMVLGCGTVKKQMADSAPSIQAPPSGAQYQPPPAAEGSLWRGDAATFYSDAKARHVGDTVTIDIVESATSKVAANTTAQRSSSIDAGIDNLFGFMTPLKDSIPNLGADDATGTQTNTMVKGEMSNGMTGKGSSDRSGSIKASIGARVAEVLSNGNLVLYGRREMRVNNETQYIVVSGTVRPEDIGSDNRVQSTYLADARIEYIGKGVLADKQQSGWLSRILDKVWPF